jgi:3-hydroxyisobutyrate dehydrogenase
MSLRVGIVGLGRMGMPICANLVRAGYAVSAWDLRPGREGDVTRAGAQWGPIATEAEVLLTVLPGPAEVRDALEEALPALPAGATWVDMSTCPPDAGRELADKAQARGVRCLDAPMGGSVDAAEAGALQLFVGGEADLLEEHRELLEVVADPAAIRHIGPHGAGYTTKLLVNLLWFGQAVATAEALLLGQREGLDVDELRAAIAASSASTEFVRSDLGALLEGDYLTSFRLDRCFDELHAVIARARELGVPHEVGSAVEGVYRRALERYGPVDGELLAVSLLEEQAGLRLRHD